jgi:hypothetical protein
MIYLSYLQPEQVKSLKELREKSQHLTLVFLLDQELLAANKAFLNFNNEKEAFERRGYLKGIQRIHTILTSLGEIECQRLKE